MNRDEQRQLLAERTSLRKMIGDIPAQDVLDRSSVEARLHVVDQRLEAVEADTRIPARARLTFRGRPVIGSHGIFAEFGMSATKAFTDAVAMIAAGLDRPLAVMGRIPNRDQNQLLITSTAIGSFGFELEEHRDQAMLLDDESVVSQALMRTQALLEGTAASDDELTDVVAGIEPRIINSIRGFLETLASNEAVCAVEFGDKKFAFQDVAQVRRGIDRLARENLHEEPTIFTGAFQGVLPKRRTFEFTIENGSTVITGKIGTGINDPDFLNRHLHQHTTITLMATRVGNGNPRYVLNRLPEFL
jgi:hypothetical protein